jgi:hypothetical protein
MSKKWYNYFVSVDRSEAAGSEREPSGGETASGESPSAAQTVAEIARSIQPAPAFSQSVTDPTSFEQVYEAADIRQPAHGFTIFKIADMLRSEHIRTLPVEIKRSSVLLALDAAGVKLEEVIQDAVRRDKALDAFEAFQQRVLDQLEGRKTEENQKLQEEADRVLNELRARIQANNDEVARERERVNTWRLKKQQEEKRIAEAVAPFASENPVSVGSAPAQAKTGDAPGR